LRDKSGVFGILSIGSLDEPALEQEEIASLTEMADDLAFAVSAIRVAVRHENLRLSLLHQRGITEKRMKKINELNKVLDAYDYSVTNALKVPLRYIKGYAQLLEENYTGALDKQGKEYLKVILRSVKDANKITDNLSMLSKAAHQDIEIEEVDLSVIARSVAANLKQLAPNRKVEFVIQPDLSCYASMHLATVLVEILFENAWKGTECSLAARIEFGQINEDKEIVFFLKDNGCGFDSQRARNIFTPFHSYHTDATFEGTGLGLATAERIVHRHGGRIWAEGELGKGATIFFILPSRNGK
jgi:light-regulated signal transduction histidine kinase (bacteriophytochrome)